MLSRVNEFVLSCAAVGVFFIAIEGGFRPGLRHGRSDDGATEHIKALQSALLGIVGAAPRI